MKHGIRNSLVCKKTNPNKEIIKVMIYINQTQELLISRTSRKIKWKLLKKDKMIWDKLQRVNIEKKRKEKGALKEIRKLDIRTS